MSFVHVSTAYANCPHNTIEEKFYDPPMDADKFIDLLDSIDQKLLDDITPQYVYFLVLIYTFTHLSDLFINKFEANVWGQIIS
ncbi:hypothetical protein HZH68_017150 [Vespula germanica]|uniref:Thioester reductase (TE) domain-containing protein n=1 Tax=Vespula germanica TaxID=30212 RepID=A0A834MN87_VESGE|nr:hypothetical protein HZH68_017150 [Vespula germanica]